MPDFTVIEGGGKREKGRPPEDFDGQEARKALRMVAVEMLRAMVRGDEADNRIGRNLTKFNDHVGRSKTSSVDIIRETIEVLHKKLNPKRDPSSLSVHIDRIIRASLRVAAEGCCDDNAAAGRRSGREQELFAAIEEYNRWHDRPSKRRPR